jgi:hypothetical protein
LRLFARLCAKNGFDSSFSRFAFWGPSQFAVLNR